MTDSMTANITMPCAINHSGDNDHPISCLRKAARIMGFELGDIYHFVFCSIEWLAHYGDVEIRMHSDDEWAVTIAGHVLSTGSTLAEALCGAVHTINGSEPATLEVSDEPQPQT